MKVLMKKIFFLMWVVLFSQGMTAQPQARRAEQQTATAQKTNANNMTLRAQISFPTEQKMNEDVVWRRDVYREIKLEDEANSGLYYPTEPLGTQMNLFTYIFKLVMAGPRHGGIAAYAYDVNTGNERFDESVRIQPLKFLDDYHIFYERTDRGVHIDDSDIPSAQVKSYYIKESAYYDQNTATFHTKVLALCPVMYREDDFGDGATKYPLFWIRYDDLAPYLAKQTIMTTNSYRGKIYKTTNMLGKTLAQIAGGDSVKLSKEQLRIDKEIEAFETHIWGDPAKRDSLDSIARLDKKGKIKVKSAKPRSRRSSVRTKPLSSGSVTPGGQARVTVRRQRH